MHTRHHRSALLLFAVALVLLYLVGGAVASALEAVQPLAEVAP